MGRSSSTTCNAAQVNMHQLGIDDPTHLGVEYDRPLKLKRNDRWAWITKPCVHFVYILCMSCVHVVYILCTSCVRRVYVEPWASVKYSIIWVFEYMS